MHQSDYELSQLEPARARSLAESVEMTSAGFDRLSAIGITSGPVAILGAGTIGLCAATVGSLQNFGPTVVLDTVAAKAEAAAHFDAEPYHIQPEEDYRATLAGVETALRGKPSVVIDAVGTSSSFSLAFQMSRPDAALLVIGNLAKKVSLPLQDLVSDEVTIIGSYGFDRLSFRASVAALPKLANRLGAFIESRCSLDEVPAVMTALARGERHERKIIVDVTSHTP